MSGGARILVVEDERSMREFLEILLRRHKYEVAVAPDGQAAQQELGNNEYDLVITDLKMPGITGIDVLKHTKQHHPDTEVIMVTAFATTETAIEAMKVGAYDYLIKPFKVDEILVTVQRALEKRKLVRDNKTLRRRLTGSFHLEDLSGRSPQMQRVFELIRRVAKTKTSVLISGESGTGKELVAQAIHALSDRSERKFVPVNCGAIPDTLMESELFGHVRGAFTGAASDKEGLFSVAENCSSCKALATSDCAVFAPNAGARCWLNSSALCSDRLRRVGRVRSAIEQISAASLSLSLVSVSSETRINRQMFKASETIIAGAHRESLAGNN